MSVKVMSWVWDHSASKGIDRLVLLAIADAADDDGSNAWPSVATIARKCGGVSPRTVQRSIQELICSGELVMESIGSGRKSSRYRVKMRQGRQPVTPDRKSPLTESHPCQPVTPEATESHPRGDADVTQPIHEPPNEPTTPRRTAVAADLETREDLRRVATHLADRIQANDADNKRPNVGRRWLNDIRLLLDVDKRPEEKVHAAIDWCQDHHFWKSNILSPGKLRAQYAQLQLRAAEESKRTDAEKPKIRRPGW